MAAATWVLAWGASAYSDSMASGSWTAASVTIGFVPLKAVVYSLLGYFATRTFLAALSSTATKRWVLPGALGLGFFALIVSDVSTQIDIRWTRHARSETLSADDVGALVQRVKSGTAHQDERRAFLRNPLCPPEMLAIHAASADVYDRAAVAANPKLDVALAEQLAGDADEQVRYMLAFNRDMPPALLSRLAADPSEYVRDTVAWTKTLPEADFNRLVADPSPKVRATAALQERISSEALDRLRADPEERVRNAANRWQ